MMSTLFALPGAALSGRTYVMQTYSAVVMTKCSTWLSVVV